MGISVYASCGQPGETDQQHAGDSSPSATEQATVADSATMPDSAYSNTGAIVATQAALRMIYADDLKKGLIDSASRTFSIFETDLNNDGKSEILVGLSGSYFCGSGGCTILVLSSEGKPISTITVTEPPLIIASTNTNGWKDLFLQSRGKWHLARYDGKKYPSNPSVLPVAKEAPAATLTRALDPDHSKVKPLF
ncbi:hypothetical protein FPE01S_01_16180 [Flavihumibacter petaseus NBRC 106054]|uniref:Uncharacterized protein n=2 Tax=Flavihumibacter TaxID=1004301 RepID=A0A0E9MYL9_9BACT|nr:hypothetical protein FPE01S_01_16180 [Flavihumibacter petaseus NBRC 106054]